jgi:predicted ferric reductase
MDVAMKTIKYLLWGGLACISLLWWAVDQTDFLALDGLFAWRNVLVQYSGIVGIGVMSLAMMLAVRPVFLERYVDGLDKMYRLHKWLGITGLLVSLSHWLLAKGPKWAVGFGWLERPVRPPRPNLPEGSLQQIFASQRGLAEGVGEWAFYLAVVLMLLALIKYFPYRRFFQTHRLLAVTYLAFVFHAVILLKFDYWASPLGAVMAVIMALGSVSAVLSLLRKRLGGRRVAAEVTAVDWQQEMGVLAVDLRLGAGWPGHQAGQFAFVTFHADEGPHPYTIASAWAGDGHVRFLIKGLGDYTKALPSRLRVGDRAVLEGPYGRFNFAGSGGRQIWISGGIGITPFVARMQALAGSGGGQPVDLFHSSAQLTPEISRRLNEDAARAKVRLHLFHGRKFAIADLLNGIDDWRNADIWFCGPAAFGRQVRERLLALGLPAQRFHQELFEMR